jgi:hypothetical protein
MRGDPSLGVHWNIREDFYHHLCLIDRLIEERYGADRVPKCGDGVPFKLATTWYDPHTPSGDAYADEIVSGFLRASDDDVRVCGLALNTEFIDDRWVDGVPRRTITRLDPALPPTAMDTSMIGRDVVDVLDGPSVFQTGAAECLQFLRRYLEVMEAQDLAAGVEPRVRLLLNHRVVVGSDEEGDGIFKWLTQEEGFVGLPDGRKRIIVEEIQELDHRERFRRTRKPGTKVIDLGVPELFVIAQGFDSTDAQRLGFKQEEVEVDHNDGRGPVVAQADYLAAFMELHIGARLRRRIASEFDKEGHEYWVRQLAVGHENNPEVGWVLIQVPDFKTFDPILAGLVPPRSSKKSKEYLAAYQFLVRDYFLEQCALVLEMPREELESVQVPYGPKLFSIIEKAGDSAQLAANGVVAGDSFGNGHFLTSGGAITGMVGHAVRVFKYWQEREEGVSHGTAIRALADAIREDTYGWLHVSAQEFSQSVPINFGAERIAEIERQTGRSAAERATTIDATRRHRQSLVPLDPSDWRRLTVHSGRLHAYHLPALQDTHPALRDKADVMTINTSNGSPEPVMSAGGA